MKVSIVFIVGSIIFTFISCGFMSYLCVTNFTKLRLACLISTIFILINGIYNYLRTFDTVIVANYWLVFAIVREIYTTVLVVCMLEMGPDSIYTYSDNIENPPYFPLFLTQIILGVSTLALSFLYAFLPALTLHTSKHNSSTKQHINAQSASADDFRDFNHSPVENALDLISRLSSTPKLCKFENCDEETFTSDSPNDPFPSSFFADQQPSSSSLSVHGHDFRNNTDSQFLPSLPSVPQLSNQHVEDFSRFADSSVEISYEDFNINSDEYSVFKLQDYCWKDHGALMVNNFLPGLGDLLDDEFQEAKELNDYYSLFQSYTQQNNDLDVAPLRQAIWYYVQRLYGLSKDDYDYSDIRNLLNSKFKMFLKKVCCTPENLTINDWRNVGFQLRSEEKCHVNLIAIESRKQSELIYGLWCVMKCQNEENANNNNEQLKGYEIQVRGPFDVGDREVLQTPLSVDATSQYRKSSLLAKNIPSFISSSTSSLLNPKTQDGHWKKLYMICGGTGIAPMLQLITYHLELCMRRSHAPTIPNKRVSMHLLYGNHRIEDIINGIELEDYQLNSAGMLTITYALNKPSLAWTGENGEIDQEMVSD
ncbi:10898_t:CDS:2, partial [Entrophospora sp. SA101]